MPARERWSQENPGTHRGLHCTTMEGGRGGGGGEGRGFSYLLESHMTFLAGSHILRSWPGIWLKEQMLFSVIFNQKVRAFTSLWWLEGVFDLHISTCPHPCLVGFPHHNQPYSFFVATCKVMYTVALSCTTMLYFIAVRIRFKRQGLGNYIYFLRRGFCNIKNTVLVKTESIINIFSLYLYISKEIVSWDIEIP